MSQSPHNPEAEKPLSVVNISTKLDDIYQYIDQNDLVRKITETSLFNDSNNRNPFSDDLVRCYALNPQENCFGIRVNTTLSFCTINQKVRPNLFITSANFTETMKFGLSPLQIFELWEKLFPKNAPAMVSAQSNVRSTQMINCAVADYTAISEKTSLKNCSLGTNCTVNMKTRISNSVLMNGVVIEERQVFRTHYKILLK